MRSDRPTLGTLLRSIRRRQGWTVNQMAERSGIPVSTLSKIEHDRLTLSYDKLLTLSDRLGLHISEFFAETGVPVPPAPPAQERFTARRSLGDIEHALRVETVNYDYHYLCTDLRRKRMIPVVTRVRAKTQEEFGELIRHAGEEFIYVLEGRIEIHTEFYDTVTLGVGQCVYIDSDMGHAYLAGDGCDEAVLLGVMAGSDEDEVRSLADFRHEAAAGPAPPAEELAESMHLATPPQRFARRTSKGVVARHAEESSSKTA
ncbi:transcriptional regulator with XRE-family HTH domain [Sphingomonas sp. UYAg733]